ncbi:DUF87 domain-containing protein [archaeon]|jgi:conjugal transfer ATP-binding protein TraC|nr:DUF87 domain-containing protein [archaeon]
MAYDIPPPLRHKEAILWGLNWNQIGYAAPALIFSLFIILKAPFPIEVSLAISGIIVTIAVFFMFFNGLNRAKNLIHHLFNQEVEVNSDTLKSIVDIQKIENDIVYNSSQKLAVLEIIPLNFLIKTKEEQETIILGFQKFLNSLDFPIQIHVSSHEIDLKEHFAKVSKKSKNYKELFKSYKQFIEESTKDIKNRKFYIIINEKDNLEIQTKVCEEKLRCLGLKVQRLQSNQLLNLFFEYIANNKQKELKEGEEIENYTHHLLSPNKITFFHDFLQVDDNFYKIIAVTGYPHSVEMGFLDKIISSGDNYDVSLHIDPFPIEDMMIQLNRELQKQQSDLYADSNKGIINPSLEIKYKSTRAVLEDLQKGKQKLFDVSLYVMCKGSSKEEAALLSKKVKADFDGLMIQSTQPTFQMQHCYESMLPLGRDTVKIKRNIHTTGLSAFFPFSSPFLDVDNDGILLGLNKNGIPYIKDIFQLTNQNGLVLATSGAGKSYYVKLMISRQHLNGCDVIIIDPQGEYLAITEHYKGETITISKDSETIINPLDLMGHEYLEKRLSLMDLFQIMFGELTEIQKAILDKSIDLTYARKGINRDSYDKKPPKLQDLYQVLKSLEGECAQQEKVTYRALLNRLGMYTGNGVFSFLDKDTNIDFDNNFVCFNIGDMPKQVKPVVMYLVLDFVYMRMKKSLQRKILVIDEAWSLLQTAEESSYIFEIVKTCRKYNMGLLMITQDVGDLVGSKAGAAVLANTSYTFLLRQKSAIISNVARTFNLSSNEKDYLVTAEAGNGIMILENEHQELKVIASEKEHELVTTNPDEMIKKNEKKKGKKIPKGEVEIMLSIEQDVYPANDLTIEDQNFLVNHDYVLGSYHGLSKGRQKEYFVKKRKPEGALHTYYVNLIYEEIRKHTKNALKSRTKEPDIVFTNAQGEKIAIEVESGIDVKYLNKKRYHNEKFAIRKKQYGMNCYIFLHKVRLENSYKRHDLPILFRDNIENFVTSQMRGYKENISLKNQTSQMANSKGRRSKTPKSEVTRDITKTGGKLT